MLLEHEKALGELRSKIEGCGGKGRKVGKKR
jgi:hypothetical protein